MHSDSITFKFAWRNIVEMTGFKDAPLANLSLKPHLTSTETPPDFHYVYLGNQLLKVTHNN